MSNESSAVTVTDMAHVLTPDGINIITAEVVRRLLDSASDADFERAFSCTKDKARAFLRRYELCRMPFWGAHELAQAIRDTDPAHAMRSVELAQKAGELPEVFPPRLGIAWAMHRCLLVHSDSPRLLGIRSAGHYGLPVESYLPSMAVAPAQPQAAAPEQGTQPKLSESDKAEILNLYNHGRGVSVNALATQYAVSRPTIDKVLKRAGIKQ